MKQKNQYLPLLLTLILSLVLLICILLRTFAPRIILPAAQIPGFVLVSAAALCLDHYVVGVSRRDYLALVLLSAAAFGLLPWAAGFVAPLAALKLAAVGAAVFTVCTWLFSCAQDRLSTGPAAKAAPVLVALGLYLTSQCFAGML